MDPSDLVPVSWDAATIFGGVAGLLGNPFILAALVIGVSIKVAPRIFHLAKRLAASR